VANGPIVATTVVHDAQGDTIVYHLLDVTSRAIRLYMNLFRDITCSMSRLAYNMYLHLDAISA